MVLFSSFSIFYMFPLGTFPSSDVLKLYLQIWNEPLFSSGRFGSCIFGCYPLVVPLSNHEASTSLQQILMLLHFETYHVSDLSTLRFLADASHTLFEMESSQFLFSVNHYKETLLGEKFDLTDCDAQWLNSSKSFLNFSLLSQSFRLSEGDIINQRTSLSPTFSVDFSKSVSLTWYLCLRLYFWASHAISQPPWKMNWLCERHHWFFGMVWNVPYLRTCQPLQIWNHSPWRFLVTQTKNSFLWNPMTCRE